MLAASPALTSFASPAASPAASRPAASGTRAPDRFGLAVSLLCIAHCLITALMVGALATLGALASPAVHHIGLALAALFALLSLVRSRPASTGRRWLVGGVALLGAGVLAGHGWPEILLSIAGAVAVAVGHWRR